MTVAVEVHGGEIESRVLAAADYRVDGERTVLQGVRGASGSLAFEQANDRSRYERPLAHWVRAAPPHRP